MATELPDSFRACIYDACATTYVSWVGDQDAFIDVGGPSQTRHPPGHQMTEYQCTTTTSTQYTVSTAHGALAQPTTCGIGLCSATILVLAARYASAVGARS